MTTGLQSCIFYNDVTYIYIYLCVNVFYNPEIFRYLKSSKKIFQQLEHQLNTIPLGIGIYIIKRKN
jgi:hypothetical protein